MVDARGLRRARASTRADGDRATRDRIGPPDGRSAPDWAAKIHVAVAPVYYHAYLYGEIVALQVAAALEARAGGIVDRPAAGALLRDVFYGPGQSVRWDELVERATGASFSVDALAREVALADA